MNKPLFCTLLALLGSIGCASRGAVGGAAANAGSTNTSSEPPSASQVSWVGPDEKADDVAHARGLEVKAFDINHDGHPDIYKFFKQTDDPQNPGNKLTLLVRKEIDINHDGKFDVVRTYDDKGQVVTEQVDLDFDGRVDEIAMFEEGVIVRKELDFNYDGKADITKYYANGHLARIESDRGHHGKTDTWEYYTDEALDRIGTDTDGDGQVDHWERRSKDGKESKATAADSP